MAGVFRSVDRIPAWERQTQRGACFQGRRVRQTSGSLHKGALLNLGAEPALRGAGAGRWPRELWRGTWKQGPQAGPAVCGAWGLEEPGWLHRPHICLRSQPCPPSPFLQAVSAVGTRAPHTHTNAWIRLPSLPGKAKGPWAEETGPHPGSGSSHGV